ncbi:MAG: DEAD/DEAH box helicase [Candidatus Latescibacteria bacterium]|nr:DEAD/DEAH box helicase [Candidatus Latescibacterota bacterium]NIM22282.1 DEAD/DEAH box helicase [Candidatus Latescibacterota bacterium]NIM65761.1 DEAD/DEAH box helicase [Candidatus Latescibacterota bacterium]NIO02146.1 DEAD/DEAH box helicase [Candidatus Latescibacterota bacterium]NIO28978.1 DEAD/DEAH box helicase [Candidatus Latescibacterota bacterium]
MDVNRFLSLIRSSGSYDGQIVHAETLSPREADYALLSPPPQERLQRILAAEGIDKLYVHQARAVEKVRSGINVVVVTGTASGKTLCYNLPVLESIVEDPECCALYLYPTKALAQDQLRTLNRYRSVDPALPLRTGTYDGDTPPSTRRKLKNEANVLLTNPDMLHSGILPNHGIWARFFERLRYVVIDEIHAYRGVFGSNICHVLRRLNRICAHYGAEPVYICCSATIRNPLELAEKLTAGSMVLVDEDGSPRGEKTVVFWNPPFLGDNVMERRSANIEASRLLTDVVKDGRQAIAFVRARVVSEVITKYAKEMLSHEAPSLSRAVKAYRGGYLPEERRRIERGLFDGELKAVVSTNALELGIDVGALECAVLVGYPGSIASTWQQAGRAGRGSEPSLVFLIPYDSPIDQYMVQHPDYFFGRTPESAVVDPHNPHIVLSHMRSAAFELPIVPTDWEGFGEYCGSILRILEEDGQVKRKGDKFYWCGGSYPSADVPLRNIGDDVYTIIERGEENRVIGTIDEASAFMQVHPGAIYLHNEETYFVGTLDIDKKIAYVEKEDIDYYTQSITEVKIKIEGEELQKKWRVSQVCWGDLSVTSLTFMFKKIKFGSRDSLGFGALDLPAQTLLTTGMWLLPSEETYLHVRKSGRIPREGLLGIANVIKEVIPIFAMCDTMDVGAAVDSSAANAPGIFVFDRYPGGLGFAHKAFELLEEIMEASLELIDNCPCENGCPSCVGSPLPPFSQLDPDVGARGLIPDKESAKSILHALLEKEPYVPSKRETDLSADIEQSLSPLPDTKPLPLPLEKKLREKVSKLKRMRSPYTR